MHTQGRVNRKIIGAYMLAILLMLGIVRCLNAASTSVPKGFQTGRSASSTQAASPQSLQDQSAPQPVPTPSPFEWKSASDAIPMVWADPRAGIFYYPGEGNYGDPEHGQYMTEMEADQAGCRAATYEQ